MSSESPASLILTVSCDDRPGIVASIASALFAHDFSIRESQQFEDRLNGRFFARVEFAATGADGLGDVSAVTTELEQVLTALSAEGVIEAADARKRVLILASRQDHCLVDLLYRVRTGDLPVDIVGVVSNHPQSVYGALDLDGVPFFYLPVDPANKREQERRVLALVSELEVDLVVLARYMQILSDELASDLAGRCINIHHSFLPGFKGAKPYHQAYERGVKIIGATAHYVTADLDEGPIIAQDVQHVSLRDLPEDLVRKGRDVERRVLARAVRAHVTNRVFVNNGRTVVFDD